MIEVAFRHMAAFTHQDKVHKDAKGLRASWSKAFEKLRYELKRVNATDVIIEAGYKPAQVRADGWPYSNAKPEHHCVRVSFKAQGKTPLAFAYNGWKEVEQNIYMIALTLERLRAVERYGCTKTGQQYAGWAQLPGNAPIAAAEWATVGLAHDWLQSIAGTVGSSDDVYRAAARKAHPDAGGTNELMSKVNRARAFIEANG